MRRYIRLTLTFLIFPPLLLVIEAIFQPNLQRFAADKELALSITHWWFTLSELANMLVGMLQKQKTLTGAQAATVRMTSRSYLIPIVG
jgi:hypothetical protein